MIFHAYQVITPIRPISFYASTQLLGTPSPFIKSIQKGGGYPHLNFLIWLQFIGQPLSAR